MKTIEQWAEEYGTDKWPVHFLSVAKSFNQDLNYARRKSNIEAFLAGAAKQRELDVQEIQDARLDLKRVEAENYEIRCRRQSWMNRIEEAEHNEKQALDQLSKFKEQIKDYEQALKIPDLDCGDSSCVFADRSKPMGMRTNGGCRCTDRNSKGIELKRHLLMCREVLKKWGRL